MGISEQSALVIIAEFKRAFAAAQRYDNLLYRHAGRDVPRRIFEEFYAFGERDAATMSVRAVRNEVREGERGWGRLGRAIAMSPHTS